jgi:hypothetical protein
MTINKLTPWFERTRLIVNKDKTIAISFNQPQKYIFESPSIKFHDIVIKYSEHSKFLGVWLDKSLKWSRHTQELAKSYVKYALVYE